MRYSLLGWFALQGLQHLVEPADARHYPFDGHTSSISEVGAVMAMARAGGGSIHTFHWLAPMSVFAVTSGPLGLATAGREGLS
jgi:hypothetical protein